MNISSEFVSHWPLPLHNSGFYAAYVRHQYFRHLLWLAAHTDQHPNLIVFLQHISGSLVNYQSISPSCVNITLITLLNIQSHLCCSCHQTITIIYNISVTSKFCAYPLSEIMSFHFLQIGSCTLISSLWTEPIGLDDF